MSIVVNSVTKLTYDDYIHFPDDGNRHEIIDGVHHMSPAPETYHQTLSRRIQFRLYQALEEQGKALVFNAPTDVQLSKTDIVQPDILVISESRKTIISPTKILGPPDLVIEILSPSTIDRDVSLKLSLYEQSGVPEYWVVDPEAHTVTVYQRETDHFIKKGEYDDAVDYRLGAEVVVLDLTRVW